MDGVDLSPEDVRALMAEARAEARIEAKEILRGKFVDAYLKAALEREKPEPAAPEPPAREPAPAPPETGDAWYVYCVGEEEIPAGLRGVAEKDVVAVEAAGLRAAASVVPLAEFGEDALRRNLNELPWLERTARAHQEVLDAANGAGTIVPLRLCTIYASEERVRAMLADQAERFREVLDLLRGKSEWGVKGYAEQGALEPAAPAGAAEEGGGAYFDRKRRERTAREEAMRAVEESVREVHARLEEWAADAVVNRPQNRELAGYEGEMVLNAAYLIEDARADEFAELVRSFDERYRDAGMRFELTGPWPPYNFVPDGGSAL